jgi:hypothetical protein
LGGHQKFLRNPVVVIEQLQQRIAAERKDAKPTRDRLMKLEDTLEEKTEERDRILGLFRKGRIKEDALNVQMDQIDREEAALKVRIDDLATQLRGTEAGAARLGSASAVLAKLRARLDEPISWERKRQLIETLVEGVRVDTFHENGKRCAAVTVTYRLASRVDICTDRGSCNERDSSQKVECRAGWPGMSNPRYLRLSATSKVGGVRPYPLDSH